MKSVVDLTQGIKDFFQPQVNSLKETLTQQINENGVKNILPTPYYQTKGGTFTGNSLTVTENSDGSVTINGTASAQSYVDLARNSTFLKPGRYILSGGKTSKQNIYINATNNGSYVRSIVSSSTEEREFTIDYNGYNAVTVGLSIAAGETLSNVTFYPMIRSASITDPTYEPYAKSNRELTEDTTPEYFDLSVRNSRCTIVAQKNCRIGKQVYLWCRFTPIVSGTTLPAFTVPDGYRPPNVGNDSGAIIGMVAKNTSADSTKARYAIVFTTGEVDIVNVAQDGDYMIYGSYFID